VDAKDRLVIGVAAGALAEEAINIPIKAGSVATGAPEPGRLGNADRHADECQSEDDFLCHFYFGVASPTSEFSGTGLRPSEWSTAPSGRS